MGEGSFAHLATLALEGLPGFAQLSHSGPIVEWGDRPSGLCRPGEREQFYGLRDSVEELDGHAWPPVRPRGHGSEAGRWPSASEQPPGRIPLLRETLTVTAAALP